MSTPALIKFEDDGAVYLHWDGYPNDILELWLRFREDVEKKSPNDTRFNDAPYCAARFVAYLVRSWWEENSYDTGIGIANPKHDYGQVYTYKVEDGIIRQEKQ